MPIELERRVRIEQIPPMEIVGPKRDVFLWETERLYFVHVDGVTVALLAYSEDEAWRICRDIWRRRLPFVGALDDYSEIEKMLEGSLNFISRVQTSGAILEGQDGEEKQT
jgi:hypothetical protein